MPRCTWNAWGCLRLPTPTPVSFDQIVLRISQALFSGIDVGCGFEALGSWLILELPACGVFH